MYWLVPHFVMNQTTTLYSIVQKHVQKGGGQMASGMFLLLIVLTTVIIIRRKNRFIGVRDFINNGGVGRNPTPF